MKYEEHIISAFLTSWKPKEIMEAAHVSKSKYYKLKNDPAFQAILTERRDAIVKSAVLKMERYIEHDVDVLQELIDDSETKAGVKVQAIALMMNQLNQWRISTDITDRMRRLIEDAESQKNAF